MNPRRPPAQNIRSPVPYRTGDRQSATSSGAAPGRRSTLVRPVRGANANGRGVSFILVVHGSGGGGGVRLRARPPVAGVPGQPRRAAAPLLPPLRPRPPPAKVLPPLRRKYSAAIPSLPPAPGVLAAGNLHSTSAGCCISAAPAVASRCLPPACAG